MAYFYNKPSMNAEIMAAEADQEYKEFIARFKRKRTATILS